MGLSVDSNEGSTDMRGVYVSQSSIVNAIDMSGKTIFDNSFDLALELEITTYFEWNKKFTLKGNFKKDPHNPKQVTDWGGAFVIRNLFKMLGFFDILSPEEQKEKMNLFQMGKIPQDFIARLKGQKIYTLSYVYKWDADKMKEKYITWNQVGLDKAKLLAEFKKSLDKGFPKNYDPDILDNKSSSYEDNNNGNGQSERETIPNTSPEDDDDLPF